MNPFIYSYDNKRYHTLSFYNKKKFGHKVFKSVIDGGFTCPNLDGTKGMGGCIFCDNGSGYFTHSPILDVEKQIELEIKRIQSKYPDARAIAYFQSHTNTYAPIEKLKVIYETAISQPYIIGLSIGTRPDCISDELLVYLQDLSRRTALTVELGLQTVHDDTARIINRCYEYKEFLVTYSKLKSHGIRVCIHIINGLPNETFEMMFETAQQVGKLKPDGLKIQLLHIIRGTEMEKMYYNGEVEPMSKEDYVNLVVKQLEYIPAETVIERITGDGAKSKLIAPLWSMDKISVLGEIDKRQAGLNSWQGKHVIQE